MSSNIKSKDRKSLCEESMLVFVNILKLSSLSLARRTMATETSHDKYHHHHHQHHDHYNHQHHDHDDHHNHHLHHNPKKKTTIYNNHKSIVVHHSNPPQVVPIMSVPQKRKKLHKPEESKVSYVMLPNDHDETTATVDGQFSDYIRRFHEKADNDLQNAIVEGKAANYIKRFHEKNMKDLNNESMRRATYVLPPPPHRQAFD